ncbi:MAG: YHS domain-containing protein [Patescibacteria group bacterium]
MENKIRSLIKKLSRFGFSVRSKNKDHIDPVCGMEASGGLFKADYKDKNYYFCSDHCREKFAANPDNYVN